MTTALVTGANRGIGLELTRQLAASGASVLAATRDPSRAQDLEALADASEGRIDIVKMDVSDRGSILEARMKIGARPIDVLINNAGVMGKAQTSLDMEIDDFLETLRVNVAGPIAVTQTFLPNLRAATGARVAVISSMMGAFGFPGAAHIGYSVSKTAVNRLFAALARDLRAEGIFVAILSPGWVRTDMGGPSAPVSVEQSAAGLLREIAATDAAASGAFRDQSGQRLAW